MKKRCLVLLIALLCLSASGCTLAGTTVWTAPSQPVLEEMDVYTSLARDIHAATTLDEMLEAFDRMSELSSGARDDWYLLEVYTYEYEGVRHLHCKLSRQFELPSYIDIIETGFHVDYVIDQSFVDVNTTKWFDDGKALTQYLRTLDLYDTMRSMPIDQQDAWIVNW